MNLYSSHLREVILLLVCAVLATLAVLASLPLWPRSKKWLFNPVDGLSFILVSVLILLFLGVL